MRAVFSAVSAVGFSVVLLLAVVPPLTAQSAPGLDAGGPAPDTSLQKPNAVYLEGLGNGGLLSWNFERLVSPALGLRAGFASWESADFWGGADASFLTFPLTLSYLPGGRGSGWELGGGLLVGRVREESARGIVNLTAILGHRWTSGGGWLYRVGFTPFYSLSGGYPDEAFFPSVGFSFGKTF